MDVILSTGTDDVDFPGVTVSYITGEVPIETCVERYFDATTEDPVIIDNSTLPSEYTVFFEAWSRNPDRLTVTVDLPKSIEIAKKIVRRAAIVTGEILRKRDEVSLTNPFTQAQLKTSVTNFITAAESIASVADLKAALVNWVSVYRLNQINELETTVEPAALDDLY